MHFNSNRRDSTEPIPFSWNDPDAELTESAVEVPTSRLKRPTKFGVFLWWSDQIPTWVHTDDIETATRLVPGNRVFRTAECENASDRELGFSTFWYGEESFRGKPALWLEVHPPGFEIDDLVEIKSQHGKRYPQIAEVSAIHWNRNSLSIEFFVSINGNRISRPLGGHEIRPAVRLGQFLSARERRLAASGQNRIVH